MIKVMTNFEIIRVDPANIPGRERYDRFFENCENAFIQQSSYWAEVIRDLGPDEPVFLLYGEDGRDLAGLPLYLFRSPFGNILTSVPQPGPLGGIFCGTLPEEKKERAYRRLLESAKSIAEENECVAMTCITHPFQNDLGLYEKYMAPDFVLENFTQFIPLKTCGNPEQSNRYNINRAVRSGCTVHFSSDLQKVREWYKIHEVRHSMLGTQPLDLRLFENIVTCLIRRGKACCILVEYGGKIVSGCFYIYHRSVADVFMLSMDPDYAGLRPNALNVDASLRYLREQGIEIYNWQSSQNRACGVYAYKQQWKSIDSPYSFVTKITGDLSIWKQAGADAVKTAYPRHYTIPYQVFRDGFDKKYFRKGD
jgi:hypothetical protein